MARKTIANLAQQHVVRTARLASATEVSSYLDFGLAVFGSKKSGVLWFSVYTCLRHVPALSTMKQVKNGFVSLLPGGKLKPPDWSSPEGSEASRLLERELTSRFIGGTFDSATPIAEVRRAHLSVLGHWTFAQLGARAASSDFEKRYPGMVAWFRSGRTPEGIERRAMQRSESRSVDLPAKMLDRALISTAEGLQHAQVTSARRRITPSCSPRLARCAARRTWVSSTARSIV